MSTILPAAAGIGAGLLLISIILIVLITCRFRHQHHRRHSHSQDSESSQQIDSEGIKTTLTTPLSPSIVMKTTQTTTTNTSCQHSADCKKRDVQVCELLTAPLFLEI